jgi:hypothetical protein
MPTAGEIRQQVAEESERRNRLAVPAFAGGVLYLLSSIIVASTANGLPTVGVLQGLEPALSGRASVPVSPRAPEVRFISHHAFPLLAGSALGAIAIGALTLILLLLVNATRFRRPETFAAARPLVLGGGIGFALVSLGHQVATSIKAHDFAAGHDFSNRAVEQVGISSVSTGTANVIIQYLALLAGLSLAAGMIAVMINALRVGLLPRWMAILGMVSGLLIFFPVSQELQLVPAFWLVMMGVMFVGRWPNGEPPAWPAGEARAWPSRADMQAARRAGQGQPALAGAGADAPPAPSRAAAGGSSRKRRKRGSRG